MLLEAPNIILDTEGLTQDQVSDIAEAFNQAWLEDFIHAALVEKIEEAAAGYDVIVTSNNDLSTNAQYRITLTKQH